MAFTVASVLFAALHSLATALPCPFGQGGQATRCLTGQAYIKTATEEREVIIASGVAGSANEHLALRCITA